MWGPASTVFEGHGDIESIGQPSYLPLAGGGARDGEEIFEHRSVRIRDGRAWRANRSESADHSNRHGVGKSTKRLLEVRASVRSDLEAKLPAVDNSRTTETARLDCIAFPAGSLSAAPALANFSARDVAPARSERSHGPGLVHETLSGGSAAYSRRRGAEVDGPRTIAQPNLRDQRDPKTNYCRGRFLRLLQAASQRNRGRLNGDRLSFVQTFVFPPSHMELLPVREAKKEQAAYDQQRKKEAGWEADVEDELNATA